MVLHAEGLERIELHYTVQLTKFKNCGDHFPAAKLALPTVDEPPANVPSSPHYHYFYTHSLPNCHCLSTGVIRSGHSGMLYCTFPQKICPAIIVFLYAVSTGNMFCNIFIRIAVHTNTDSQCDTISCLASCIRYGIQVYSRGIAAMSKSCWNEECELLE